MQFVHLLESTGLVLRQLELAPVHSLPAGKPGYDRCLNWPVQFDNLNRDNHFQLQHYDIDNHFQLQHYDVNHHFHLNQYQDVIIDGVQDDYGRVLDDQPDDLGSPCRL